MISFIFDSLGIGIGFLRKWNSFLGSDTAYLSAILCPNSETPCLKKDIYSFLLSNYFFDHLPNFNDHAFASDLEQVPLEPSIVSSTLVISPGETATLTANHYLADSYLWSNNETTQSIIVDQAGIYSVTVSDGCCSTGTTEIEVMENVMNGVNNLDELDYVIFPNPANEFFNIVFENGQKFELTLLDALGRVILHPVSYIEQARIETGNLLPGTFWLKIKLKGKVHWEPVVVVR